MDSQLNLSNVNYASIKLYCAAKTVVCIAPEHARSAPGLDAEMFTFHAHVFMHWEMLYFTSVPMIIYFFWFF